MYSQFHVHPLAREEEADHTSFIKYIINSTLR